MEKVVACWHILSKKIRPSKKGEREENVQIPIEKAVACWRILSWVDSSPLMMGIMRLCAKNDTGRIDDKGPVCICEEGRGGGAFL